ncbi:MAG: N-6 DNA methylase [Planctomycetaceae bacterium]|jgi:type I restriction-modification system DNA methylase subunit|nr:N-6 DNA methylase [Planctomycetaceae bacterium]
MTNKETAYKKITELVEKYLRQRENYEDDNFNEAQTRIDFINPFFEALGWDIDNKSGYSESNREVIHEDKVKVNGTTKVPDYAFRLGGGNRLFFVEAKKPSDNIKNINIKKSNESAQQLRRYAWHKKLAISILTNFKEFAVYDCTVMPKHSDNASTGRLAYLTCQDYLNQKADARNGFEFLWNTFCKDNVLKGGLERFIKSDTYKRGAETVDGKFLQLIDGWRIRLAREMCRLNPQLTEDELNFVVQQTLDRIIFLRIAEGRGIESQDSLKKATEHGDFYKNLFHLFVQADEKYNSGLFDFEKDRISKLLIVDNHVIKAIVKDLYPPSPYDFVNIPVEILGTVYEQFLGKTIRLTHGHHIKVEEKPEVIKTGGVVYTPQYIVNYIVQNTIGRLVEGRTPKEVCKIKIVDPACGSGSFLLGVYQYLLDWHRDYYLKNTSSSKGRKDDPLTPLGHLTTAEKKRILLNNLYGVDIDVNAVEVTKLSLLLKCMEGETEASIETQRQLFHERVLPSIDDNIRDGNSLIDTDFYDNNLEFSEEKNIKPFSWKRAFPDVFKQGGFDAVIGNPPYVMLQNLETKSIFDYSLKKFVSAKYKIDAYQLFIERAISLSKENALLGFITPNTYLKNVHAEPLRKLILDYTIIHEILLFYYSVFPTTSVDTSIILLEKGKASKNTNLQVSTSDTIFKVKKCAKIKQSTFSCNTRCNFNLFISDNDLKILDKIAKKSVPLEHYCGAYFGIQTFDRIEYVSKIKKNKHYEPVVDGRNIEPYRLINAEEYVQYIPSAIKSGGNEAIYRQDRIGIRQIGVLPIATLIPANIFTLNTIYNVFLKNEADINLKFLLGIINSQVTKYFWKKKNSDEKRTFPKIKKEAILSIPVPSTSKDNKDSHDTIVSLVDQLLKLNTEKSTVKLTTKSKQIVEKIAYCEHKIDDAVYQLYRLTKNEIEIIEGK